MMPFVRDVVRIPRQSTYRIVGFFGQRAYLFDLAARRMTICEYPLAEITTGLERGKIALVDGKEVNAGPNATCSNAQLKRAKQHLSMVRDLLAPGEEVFWSSQRRKLVRRTAHEHHVCSKTVRRALHLFWQRGMSLEALLPKFDACGAPGKERRGDTPRGRRPAPGLQRAPSLTDKMLSAFESCTDRYYRPNRHITLSETYRRVCEQLATRCVFDEETNQPVTFLIDEDVALPTERQFRYWYLKQDRAKSDRKARLGDVKFALTSRARLSFAAQDNEVAGGRWVVDATKLDCNLVARHDRRKFIGTPVLYLVVDEFTAMITGFWIGLEEASWQACGMAILSTLEDKVELARRHGLEIEPGRWDVAGMAPMRYLFDRGEAKGDKASGFAEKSGLIVENTAPYRGDLKGINEKRFDLVNCAFRGEVPGSRDEDSGKRGEKDSRLEAILDLDEVAQVALSTIVFLNDRELEGFRQSRAMIVDDVPPIASAMWEWCLRTGRSALQRFEMSELAISVMPTGTGTITNQGVRFDGLFYTCDRAETEGWFEAVNAPGVKRHLELSYHPWLVDAVYLHVPGEKEPLQALLTPYSRSFAGFSFDELHAIRLHRRIGQQGRQLDSVLNHAEFRNRVAHIVERAARKRLSDLRSRDLKDARANKAAERIERREEAKQDLREDIKRRAQPTPQLARPQRDEDDLGEGSLD